MLPILLPCWLTFAITGSKKRCDEGAPLFTVRVDGVVSHAHLTQTSGLNMSRLAKVSMPK